MRESNDALKRELEQLQNENFGLAQRVMQERQRVESMQSDRARLQLGLEVDSERFVHSASALRAHDAAAQPHLAYAAAPST